MDSELKEEVLNRWEYLVYIPPFSTDIGKLEKLGADGWELVSVIQMQSGTVYFYLKRKLA